MGSMNATGWLLVVGADRNVNALWDFAEELNDRIGAGRNPGLHGFNANERARGLPRFCFHPDSTQENEFRSDDLADVLTQGCAWLARQLPEDDLWRRD